MTDFIRVQININTDCKTLWEVYTDPKHIVHWNFASEDWHCPSAEVDLRVGGTYTARMEAKDGSFGFDFGAIYEEIVPHELLVYRIMDGRKVIANFSEVDGVSNLEVLFEGEQMNPRDMQQAGWQAILDNLKHYIHNNLN